MYMYLCMCMCIYVCIYIYIYVNIYYIPNSIPTKWLVWLISSVEPTPCGLSENRVYHNPTVHYLFFHYIAMSMGLSWYKTCSATPKHHITLVIPLHPLKSHEIPGKPSLKNIIDSSKHHQLYQHFAEVSIFPAPKNTEMSCL